MRKLAGKVLSRWGYSLARIAPQESWTSRFWDDSEPLPAGAEEYLRSDNPRLLELREAYSSLAWPVCERGRWREDLLDPWLDLRYFRGDNPFVWHYREPDELVSRLRFYTYLRYVADRDHLDLLPRLGEDGAFGCWTYQFPGYPPCSRDLLDSVNELYFLDRHTSILSSRTVRVLDIGAGYGRLAHRLARAADTADHCCVDAIPESSFLCEYYVKFRGVSPPARVVVLPDVPSLAPGSFDLVLNVHSFSECSLAAVEWWLDQIVRLQVPRLFLVPNEPEGFLTTEPDGSRRDFGEALARAGYRLIAEERKFTDEAVRQLLEIDDRYCLFGLG